MGLRLDDDAVGEHIGAMEVLFACSQTLHRWCCSCTELQRNLVCNMLKKILILQKVIQMQIVLNVATES